MEINLLQEYTFVCLDIFNNIIHNKDKKIENKLEEWLVFLSQDDPDMIMKLRKFPSPAPEKAQNISIGPPPSRNVNPPHANAAANPSATGE